jgi:MoaA/NifB/PqqE/SkfB family radical SAM enzyme
MDQTNTNKQLRIYDSNGKFVRLSVDEAIANNFNQWKAWQCSAGIRGLYIDYDGNILVCNTASSNVDKENFERYKEKFDKIMATTPDQEKPTKSKELLDKYNLFKNNYKKSIPATEENKIKYPGFLGNIYDGFSFNTEWFTCPWSKCTCSADIRIGNNG